MTKIPLICDKKFYDAIFLNYITDAKNYGKTALQYGNSHYCTILASTPIPNWAISLRVMVCVPLRKSYPLHYCIIGNFWVMKQIAIGNDLKLRWTEQEKITPNTDSVYGKLKQRFYAFSEFCYFKPSAAQKQYFIRSLIKPAFTYDCIVWCSSAAKKQINKINGQFKNRNFDLRIGGKPRFPYSTVSLQAVYDVLLLITVFCLR